MPLSNIVRVSRHIIYVAKGDFNKKGKVNNVCILYFLNPSAFHLLTFCFACCVVPIQDLLLPQASKCPNMEVIYRLQITPSCFVKRVASQSIMKKISKLSTFVANSSSKSQFPTELCMAFIDAGIPLWKLEKKSLRGFLEKYTKQHIPSESSLRKNYIDNNFNNLDVKSHTTKYGSQ
ncbi:hypothetical protein T09_15762 [Trichinella sp. T9]|nr:hypothetical protein T09_15762 [Trichinella sp. T9]